MENKWPCEIFIQEELHITDCGDLYSERTLPVSSGGMFIKDELQATDYSATRVGPRAAEQEELGSEVGGRENVKGRSDPPPETHEDARALPTEENAHIKGRQPYKCDVCGSRFARKTPLAYHRRHECGRELRCSKCTKLFDSKDSLNRHTRHECGEVHRCPKCDKTFVWRSTLERHLVFVCGTELRCPMCDKVFEKKLVFGKHVKYECGKK